MNTPKRIWINPEYGKLWTGTVLRTYNDGTVAIVHPDNVNDPLETRQIDLEFEGWASLDSLVNIPDDITSEEDYLYYSAIAKEFNLD